MSLGLGLGVGLPFLAEVSVTGTYDKDVMENTDVSIPFLCYFGAMILTNGWLSRCVRHRFDQQ